MYPKTQQHKPPDKHSFEGLVERFGLTALDVRDPRVMALVDRKLELDAEITKYRASGEFIQRINTFLRAAGFSEAEINEDRKLGWIGKSILEARYQVALLKPRTPKPSTTPDPGVTTNE